jgi:hypothetical protein
VQGNRPADEMRTEDQSMCRRVRLTVRLGLEPRARSADPRADDASNEHTWPQRRGEWPQEAVAMPKGRVGCCESHPYNDEIDAPPVLRPWKCQAPRPRIVQALAEARTRGDAPRHAAEAVGRWPRSPTRKPRTLRGSDERATCLNCAQRIPPRATSWKRWPVGAWLSDVVDRALTCKVTGAPRRRSRTKRYEPARPVDRKVRRGIKANRI